MCVNPSVERQDSTWFFFNKLTYCKVPDIPAGGTGGKGGSGGQTGGEGGLGEAALLPIENLGHFHRIQGGTGGEGGAGEMIGGHELKRALNNFAAKDGSAK
ncbi:hypothetical protein B0H19DRAFT_1074716 [Mycena capillaripes]|nr:hypothetical protein B0H19DRAFT_1074716 [Mycena capillaripes]